MIPYLLTQQVEVVFDVAERKRADATSIEVYGQSTISGDDLFVAVLNSDAAVGLPRSCPQVVTACHHPADTQSSSSHNNPEQPVPLVNFLVSVEADEQGNVSGEVMQVTSKRQAEPQGRFQEVSEAIT